MSAHLIFCVVGDANNKKHVIQAVVIGCAVLGSMLFAIGNRSIGLPVKIPQQNTRPLPCHTECSAAVAGTKDDWWRWINIVSIDSAAEILIL